jgi:hypothetical protein
MMNTVDFIMFQQRFKLPSSDLLASEGDLAVVASRSG